MSMIGSRKSASRKGRWGWCHPQGRDYRRARKRARRTSRQLQAVHAREEGLAPRGRSRRGASFAGAGVGASIWGAGSERPRPRSTRKSDPARRRGKRVGSIDGACTGSIVSSIVVVVVFVFVCCLGSQGGKSRTVRGHYLKSPKLPKWSGLPSLVLLLLTPRSSGLVLEGSHLIRQSENGGGPISDLLEAILVPVRSALRWLRWLPSILGRS